jgi:hypothetical protein
LLLLTLREVEEVEDEVVVEGINQAEGEVPPKEQQETQWLRLQSLSTGLARYV